MSVTSLLEGKYIQALNFQPTVLGAYWELGVGIGTKMTARSCTFSSLGSFLILVLCVSCVFGKPSEFVSKTQLRSPPIFELRRGEVREIAEKSDNYFHDAHPPQLCQSSVLTVSALKIYIFLRQIPKR